MSETVTSAVPCLLWVCQTSSYVADELVTADVSRCSTADTISHLPLPGLHVICN